MKAKLKKQIWKFTLPAIPGLNYHEHELNGHMEIDLSTNSTGTGRTVLIEGYGFRTRSKTRARVLAQSSAELFIHQFIENVKSNAVNK